MRWDERLLLLLATSRRTGRIYLLVIAGCCATQTRTGYVAAATVCGLLCATLIAGALPALRELRRTWRGRTDIAQGREDARLRALRPKEENINEIEPK